MMSNEMLLSTMNSDFSEKSFLMLYVKNVCKYLFIFTRNSLKWCQTSFVEYNEFKFQLEIICNVACEECLQRSIYIYHLFYQMVSHDLLLSMINSDFSRNSFILLCEECLQISMYIYT